MAVHLELIADTPAELAAVTNLCAERAAKVELTPEGDLYLSIDLRPAPATPDHPAIALAEQLGADVDIAAIRRQELAELTRFREAAAVHVASTDEAELAALARVDERIALLHGLVGDDGAPVRGVTPDDPRLWDDSDGDGLIPDGPHGSDRDDADGYPPHAWDDPVPADQLIDMGAATVRSRPAEGDRVVMAGDGWPLNGPARRYLVPDPVIGTVIAVDGGCVVVDVSDGDTTVHPNRVAVVEQVNPLGQAAVVLGDYPDAEHDGHTVVIGVPDMVDGKPHVPADSDPQSESESPAQDGPERPRDGTCQAAILEAVEKFPDNTWSIADIITAVDGFTEGTIKVSISPLVAAGWLYRPEPGKHRLRGH